MPRPMDLASWVDQKTDQLMPLYFLQYIYFSPLAPYDMIEIGENR